MELEVSVNQAASSDITRTAQDTSRHDYTVMLLSREHVVYNILFILYILTFTAVQNSEPSVWKE